MKDEPEFTKEEIEQRAQELARRVMSTPYRKQEWPRKPKAQRRKAPSDAATPRKPTSGA